MSNFDENRAEAARDTRTENRIENRNFTLTKRKSVTPFEAENVEKITF